MNYKILIIALLLGGLAIVAASVGLGVMKRDMQVEPSPYEAGLRYEETMKKYAELGWKAEMPGSLKVGDKFLSIRLLDRNGGPLEHANVGCILTECANIEAIKAACGAAVGGYYRCPADFDRPGCRNVRINVSRDADNMVFDKKVIVERRQEG